LRGLGQQYEAGSTGNPGWGLDQRSKDRKEYWDGKRMTKGAENCNALPRTGLGKPSSKPTAKRTQRNCHGDQRVEEKGRRKRKGLTCPCGGKTGAPALKKGGPGNEQTCTLDNETPAKGKNGAALLPNPPRTGVSVLKEKKKKRPREAEGGRRQASWPGPVRGAQTEKRSGTWSVQCMAGGKNQIGRETREEAEELKSGMGGKCRALKTNGLLKGGKKKKNRTGVPN